MEDIKYPNCVNCIAVLDVWKLGIITDAFQKDEANHYEFTCPHCKTKQVLTIPLQEED